MKSQLYTLQQDVELHCCFRIVVQKFTAKQIREHIGARSNISSRIESYVRALFFLCYLNIRGYDKFYIAYFPLSSYGTMVSGNGYRPEFQAFVSIQFAGCFSRTEFRAWIIDPAGYTRLLIMPSLFTIHVQFTLDLLALDVTCERGAGRRDRETVPCMLHRAYCVWVLRLTTHRHGTRSNALQSAVRPIPAKTRLISDRIYVYLEAAALLFRSCRLRDFLFRY
jgi:hypothetical protein